MKYFIAYDIREDRIRTRVVRLLEQNARRLQKSLFVGDYREAEAHGIERELLALTADAEQPRLLVAPLCAACTARAWTVGEPLEPERKFFVA